MQTQTQSQIVYLLIVKVKLDNYGYNVLMASQGISFGTTSFVRSQIVRPTFIRRHLPRPAKKLTVTPTSSQSEQDSFYKIYVYGVPTIYLWKKNEEKRCILSVFSEYKNVGKNKIFIFFGGLFLNCFKQKLTLNAGSGKVL